MMERAIVIQTDSGLFLSDEGGVRLTEHTFTASRMGIPQLTATLMYPRCLDDEWSGNEYVLYRGEKYLLSGTPTSSKSNTDIRYKHELVFRSEREVLANSYFCDAVPSWSSTYDKPNTNSTEFVFYGTPAEFVDRLNCALRQAKIGDSILEGKTTLTMSDTPVGDGYCAVLDPDGGYDLEQSREFSASDAYIWDVMSDAVNTYNIPFEFRGKLIVWGAANRVIDHLFQYGHDNELLSVTKTNADAKVINRITFKGSDENIPYYYPNESEYGHITVKASEGNSVLTTEKVSVANMTQLLALAEPDTPIILRQGQKGLGNEVSLGQMRYESRTNQWQTYTFNQWADVKSSSANLDVTIGVEVAGHYILRSIVGGTWALNTSSPGGYSDLMANRRFFSGISLYKSDGTPVPVSLMPDGKIDLGELQIASYRLVIHFITIHPVSGELKAWAVGAVHIDPAQTDYLYWTCGDKKMSELGGFGLRYDGEITEDAVGDSFVWTAAGRMPFQKNLVPPIYIETLGDERFYDAVNGKYLKEDGETYYEFKNPLAGIPHEYIYSDDTIKPTIEGIKNASGQLFGEIAGIAFDETDNDSLSADATDSDKNDALKYEHSFFYIRLNIFNGPDGFDLFNSASQTDAMTLQMTSGPCDGCKFKIQAYEREIAGVKEFRNPVQTDGADGNIVSGDYAQKVNGANLQAWQQDTTEHSIWIAVQKDADTFGVLMPNRSHNYMPKVGDTFNIIHIELPESYKRAAERKGMHAALQFMEDNNEEKFTFAINASRIFFAENPDMLAQIDENAMLRIGYDGKEWMQFVSSVEITYKDSEPLPDIRISLVNDIAAGKSFVQNIIDQVDGMTQGVLPPSGGASTEPVVNLTQEQADRRYVRKDSDDRTPHKLSTDTAFEVGEFVSGVAGGIFDIDPVTGHTRIETDYLKVRLKAIYESLELVKVNTIGGKQIITPGGGMTISFVEELSDFYRCYFKQEEDGVSANIRFVAGDQAYCQEFNLADGKHKRYWRLVMAVDNEAAYIDLSKVDHELAMTGEDWIDVPAAGDVICQLGNRSEVSRQSAIIMSTVDANSPDITLYHGINRYTLVDKEYVSYGVDKSNANSPRAFFKVYGDAYIGNRDGSAYMRYTPEKGLEVRGRISSLSTIDDKPIDKYIGDKVGDMEASFLVRYSATGGTDESEWHSVYQDGDVWVQTSNDGGETWSEPIRFGGKDGTDGTNGTDGKDGKWLKTQWAKADSPYALPVITAWHETPPNIDPGEYLWMRQGWVTPPATEPESWMKPQRITGEQGQSGQDVYLLDFTDEVIGFECEQLPDNDYLGKPKTTQARVFRGSTLLTEGVTYSIVGGEDNLDVSIDATSGLITISDIYDDVVRLSVQAVVSGVTLTATVSLYKAYGGENAVLYQILPSVDNITKDALGNLSVQTVTCTVYRITGGTMVTTRANRLTYRIMPDGVETDIAHANDGTTAPIAISPDYEAIIFTLYGSGGMVLDRERVPIFSDASGMAVGGVNLLRNTAFFTSDRWTFHSGVSIDASTRFNGNNSLHINQTGFTADQYRGAVQGFSQNGNLRVSSGEYITASLWSYCKDKASISNGANCEIRFHKADGEIISRFGITPVPSSNNVWERASAQAIAPAGTYSVSFYAYVVRNGELWIAEPQIERGTVLTDWSPSPDDYSYIAEALKNSGSIEGGLILGSVIKLGYDDVDGNKVVTAGMNGLLQEGARSRDLAFWAGGDMNDRGEPDIENGATFAIRHDGTAYAANNTVRFEENQVGVGDDVYLNDEGLRLQDNENVKVLISNKSVSSDFDAFASSTIDFSKALSTTTLYFGLNGLRTVFYRFTSPIRIPINGVKKGDAFSISINANTIHSMDFTPSSATPDAFPRAMSSLFSIRLYSGELKIFDFPVPCSSEITNSSRPYQRRYSVSQRYSASAYEAGDYIFEIYFPDDVVNAPIKSTSTLNYRVDGTCRTLGTNQTLLGNNGFSSIWRQSAFAVNNEGIILRVGDYGLRIDEQGITITNDGGSSWSPLY